MKKHKAGEFRALLMSGNIQLGLIASKIFLVIPESFTKLDVEDIRVATTETEQYDSDSQHGRYCRRLKGMMILVGNPSPI